MDIKSSAFPSGVDNNQPSKNAVASKVPLLSPLPSTPPTSPRPFMSPKFRRLSGARLSDVLTEVVWVDGDLKLMSECGRAEGGIEVCREGDLDGTWW